MKRIPNSLMLRSLCALFTGALVVAAFIVLLSLYGAAPETMPAPAAQALRFPENEQMLDALSAQLTNGSAALPDIAPAAGETQIPKKTK